MIAWDYAPSHAEVYQQYDYAFLYAQVPLLEACPPESQRVYKKYDNLRKAYIRSYREVELKSVPEGFSLVPLEILAECRSLKQEISESIIGNLPCPANYVFLRDLRQMVVHISKQKLKINDKALYRIPNSLMQQRLRRTPAIKYNIFGSTTGRLTTSQDSFPILNLPKNYRAVIEPQNDRFLEFDLKSAELRLFLKLIGNYCQSEIEDLHQWNADNIFHGSKSEAKVAFFKWLFSNSNDEEIQEFYCKASLLGKYYNGDTVITPFLRHIPADDFHAISYLIQSTSSDMVQEQAIQLFKFLKGRKSFLSFTIHDSVIIDYALEDRIWERIKAKFEKTRFGHFPATMAVGKNFGEMIN